MNPHKRIFLPCIYQLRYFYSTEKCSLLSKPFNTVCTQPLHSNKFSPLFSSISIISPVRASASARGNWKDLFPSLSRQPSTTAAAAADPSDSSSSSSAAQNQMSALARFCHGCGNPFPMPHVRFCCECGMRRLYT